MKKLGTILAIGVLVVAVVVFGYRHFKESVPEIAVAHPISETSEAKLIGYTKYVDYLVIGKQSLQEQIKLLTAKIVRSDTHIEHITADGVLFNSDATVLINYTTEYSFGFDLKPDTFDVRQGKNGIEIIVSKPMLVTSPAILSQSYSIPNTSIFIDSKKAVIKLYEQLPAISRGRGKLLAQSPEVVALCEKQLITFFKTFLLKMPGVVIVPSIDVVYK